MEADHQVKRLMAHWRRLGACWRSVAHALLLLCLVGASSDGVNAHPSHASYAELEWSAKSLDVALKLVPEDLERALSLLAGENITLVDTPPVRTLLQTYLARRFRLLPVSATRDQASVTASLTLVGMQLDYRETWLYFRVPADPDVPYALENTLLMELEPTQTNRARRLWAAESPTLVFTVSEPQRPLAVKTH